MCNKCAADRRRGSGSSTRQTGRQDQTCTPPAASAFQPRHQTQTQREKREKKGEGSEEDGAESGDELKEQL